MKVVPIIRIKPIDPLGNITERNDGPRCNRAQVEYFKRNWNQILPPRVIRSAKKHHDVLHGARSVNMIVGKKYARPTKDFDVYAHHPSDRAKEIEDHIDRECGCDMAYIEKRIVPNVSGIEDELMADKLYIVKTPNNQNGDVDYMPLPPRLPIIRRKGLYHESLEEAYRKAQRGLSQPMRAHKATKDIARIEAYWLEKKRRR